MSPENLNLILTNATCCSAKLAASVSTSISIGKDCDDDLSQLIILNDSIDVLLCFTENDTLTEDNINKLIDNIMSICDICYCQLKPE